MEKPENVRVSFPVEVPRSINLVTHEESTYASHNYLKH